MSLLLLLLPHDLGRIHRQHGHFVDQIWFFLFSTTLPANAHYSFPEWYWTSFRTAVHEGDDLYGRVLLPIPAEGCLETGKYALE